MIGVNVTIDRKHAFRFWQTGRVIYLAYAGLTLSLFKEESVVFAQKSQELHVQDTRREVGGGGGRNRVVEA